MKLYELSAFEIADLIKKGEVTAVEAAESMLSRIDEVEGRVEALLYCERETALNEAKAVQEKIDVIKKAGGEMPELAGVPVIIKDNICTKGVPTTCASKMLRNFIPPYDATVMKKLKANLCVPIAKANMDEFAMGSSCEYSAFKKTRNPFNTEYVPGGSSGGSAAAVAALMAPLSLGTDTGGSIRMPASFCGITGLKPTYGAVSRYGVVAFASSLDQVGPLGRSAKDCALLFDAISGHDPLDSTSANITIEKCAPKLETGVRGLKIGLPKQYFALGLTPGVRNAVETAVRDYEAMGAVVGEVDIPELEYALGAYYIISSAEASSNLAKFDGVRYGFRAEGCKNADELFVKTRSEGFGAEVKRRIMLGTYALCSGYYDEYYSRALKVRSLVKAAFDRAFEKYDVLLSPTAATTAFKIGERIQDALAMYSTDLCTVSVNIAGLPALALPCGMEDGLPVGMQIIGRPFTESALLAAAHAYQQTTGHHLMRPGL